LIAWGTVVSSAGGVTDESLAGAVESEAGTVESVVAGSVADVLMNPNVCGRATCALFKILNQLRFVNAGILMQISLLL